MTIPVDPAELPPFACARDMVDRWESNHPPRRQQQRTDQRPTPQATIEAILHGVRQRGVAALKEPAQVERLSRCDAAAKAAIDKRIAILLSKESVR
jgi:hypothetical protein